MILTKKQTIAIDYLEDTTTKEILFGGSAGGGKSVLGVYWILKNSLKYPGTRWLIGRAKLKTLKETTLKSFQEVAKSQGVKEGLHYNYNSQSGLIKFFNGSEILLKDLFYYPSDPEFDELGSLEITGSFIDEVSQITEKAWNITRSRIRFNLDKYGLIPTQLGTCNPSKGFVYSRFYKPSKEGTLAADKKFIQSLVTDNKFISKHYIDNLESLDELSKQRLLYGNWEYDDNDGRIINYEKIVDLFVNVVTLDSTTYITCDVARFGNDNTIIRVWRGFESIHKVKIGYSKTTEVSQKIRQLQREYKVLNAHTIVDEDGVGGGVVDQLDCVGFVGNSRPFNTDKNYQNLRSQCYFELANKINSNEIRLNDLDVTEREMIVAELEQIKQKNIDKDGKLQIISKEEIKPNIGNRSPDEADCLMMRMYFVFKKKSKGIRKVSYKRK